VGETVIIAALSEKEVMAPPEGRATLVAIGLCLLCACAIEDAGLNRALAPPQPASSAGRPPAMPPPPVMIDSPTPVAPDAAAAIDALSVADAGPSVEGVVTARALGSSCNGPADCDSGFCADGVCCASACLGICEAVRQRRLCGWLLLPATGVRRL
jgi:hypothetical protein